MTDTDAPAGPPVDAGSTRVGRRGVIAIAILAAAVIALVLLWGGGPDTKEAMPLSARIELANHSVAAGGSIDGEVIVENNTGADIEVNGCGSIFQVALANDEVQPHAFWSDCLEEFTIPTGESSWPVSVRAHHLSCTRRPDSGGLVPCADGDGSVPPLPAGTYEARLYQRHETVPEPSPVQVRVVVDP